MRNLVFSLSVIAMLFLQSCGEEIGRLPINQVSNKATIYEESTILDLKNGEKIEVWSEMEMAYNGDPEIFFLLTILFNGEQVEQLKYDPREKSITMNEMRTTVNGNVEWKFTGKNGKYTVEEDGLYTFTGLFFAPNSVRINKAEIVLKK